MYQNRLSSAPGHMTHDTDLYLSVVAAPGLRVVVAQAGAQVGGDEQNVPPKLDIVVWLTLR